ncbi:cell division protein FtsL [Anaerosalibacter sp. Marseille-P3206]|uniref:cell division protein FtsL n=1 Tax=Anaerosalibacter sp. Marseille-P3206 TaxID=1871005 RepID=UPI000986BA5A|nr:cell division protein FtsL [Anaerosalibacter sp. Marseille-P3206]
MLVARKEECYDYSRNKNKVKRKKVVKNKNKSKVKNKLKLFTSAIIVLLLCMLVLLKYASITKTRLEITKLENEKVKLVKEKEDMITELDRVKNSIKIEEDARTKLGMDYPTKDQIVYVSVNSNIGDEEVAEEELLIVKYFKDIVNIVLKIF